MRHADLIAAIRREILIDPYGDLPRLQLADALMDSEDAGERAEGEFVAASMRHAMGAADWSTVLQPFWAISQFLFDRDGPGFILERVDGKLFESDHHRFYYHRGLPHTWAVADMPTFEREAKDVFSRWPIVRVVLRCEVGRSIADRAYSTTALPCDPFAALFRLLRNGRTASIPGLRYYHTSALALADLESACVVHGRRLAGLTGL